MRLNMNANENYGEMISARVRRKLSELRQILDDRFRDDVSEKDFETLDEIHDMICRALDKL